MTISEGRVPSERRRSKWKASAYIVLALGFGALLAYLFHHPKVEEPASAPSRGANARPSARLEKGPRRESTRPVAEVFEPPVISNVTLEKTSVCEGEENLVTVEAFLPGHSDRNFRVAVGNQEGRRVPLRRWLDASGDAPPVEVSAWGPDGQVTTVPVPSYRVRSCPPRPWLEVASLRVPNESFVYELTARLHVPPSEGEGEKSPKVRSYSWDFGDGNRLDAGRFVEHDFEPRERTFEHFERLVEVVAVLEDGARIVGRTLLVLPAPAFDDDEGRTRLVAKFTPRYPKLDERGVVEQKVRLFHLEAQSVRIERLLVSKEYLHEGRLDENADAPEPSPENEVDPSEILPTLVIPPGPGIEFRVRLDTQAEPDTALVRYAFRGTSEDGRVVHGEVAVMRPPAPPTPEEHVPVEDAAMMERIQRAQRLLGRPTVTESELRKLEAENAFADLPPIVDDQML